MTDLTFGDHYVHFNPLVWECFGVWTPFALSTLFTIVSHITVVSGVSRQYARKQLLQHLSVTLRQYNAKDLMILRHCALCPDRLVAPIL